MITIAKYYAVKKGRQVGIFLTWSKAQKQVNGFSGARYKRFTSRKAAEQYLNGDKSSFEESTSSSEIVAYTDGGSRNTGNKKADHVHRDDKSAWAYLIQFHGKRVSNSGSAWGATNNQMELTALLSALQWLVDNQLPNKSITVVSDSHYVLDAINKKWLWVWQKRGWKTASGTPVKNVELWQTILQLLKPFKHLKFKWTKGHAENAGNVFVDGLLNQKMNQMKKTGDPTNNVTKTNIKTTTKRLSPTPKRHSKMDGTTQKSIMALANSLKNLGIDVNIK